jgi:hypothetical protein
MLQAERQQPRRRQHLVYGVDFARRGHGSAPFGGPPGP